MGMASWSRGSGQKQNIGIGSSLGIEFEKRTACKCDPGRVTSETNTCYSPLNDVPLNLRVYVCGDIVDQERNVMRCTS